MAILGICMPRPLPVIVTTQSFVAMWRFYRPDSGVDRQVNTEHTTARTTHTHEIKITTTKVVRSSHVSTRCNIIAFNVAQQK